MTSVCAAVAREPADRFARPEGRGAGLDSGRPRSSAPTSSLRSTRTCRSLDARQSSCVWKDLLVQPAVKLHHPYRRGSQRSGGFELSRRSSEPSKRTLLLGGTFFVDLSPLSHSEPGGRRPYSSALGLQPNEDALPSFEA